MTGSNVRGPYLGRLLTLLAAVATVPLLACEIETTSTEEPEALAAEPTAMAGANLASGRDIFRFDDFGDWRFWTDTLRLNDAVETLSPLEALGLGLKVDAAAVPPAVLAAVLGDPVALNDPATTRALLTMNAVVGVVATVSGDQITRLGITCALCHSTVDNSVSTLGIGQRRDGWANHDLRVGPIIASAPGLPAELQPTYANWGPGFYDARFNMDGIDDPQVIPPAYGLKGVGLETYTAEGPISYWNNYVAVTQMHGRGSFSDPRLGVDIRVAPQEDLVLRKLPALRQYQRSLPAPPPPAGSFDAAGAARGKVVFETVGKCSTCHVGPLYTDHGNLHEPDETDMDPTHAERSTTKLYRTTPLRALWQHAPYFHDGSAETLADVVDHYVAALGLTLTPVQRNDLIEFLKSL